MQCQNKKAGANQVMHCVSRIMLEPEGGNVKNNSRKADTF